MSWVGVITNAGQAMLQSVAGGDSMVITSVKTGTGYVSTSAMKEQTALQAEVTSGQISKNVRENGVYFSAIIGPHDSSYTMKEVGVFGKIGEGEPALFMLWQNTDGIVIPDIDDFPDFTYSVTSFVTMENTDNVTLEIDPDAFVASSTFEAVVADINSEIDDIEGDIDDLQTAVAGKAAKTEAIKNITRNGLTFTATRTDNTTFTFTQQDTTYNDMGGATSTAAGSHGLVPAPASGKNLSFLRGDGTWNLPSVFTGASASAAGSAGFVKAPAAGEQAKFLKGDGNWGVPTDTTYSEATSSAYGLVKIGYTASGKNYPVQLDGGKMYVNVPWVDTNTDTKNTAGSTDTSSKIFLIGATSQAANPQTYSHDTAYVGTDGCLYSGGAKVLTAHQDISGKKNTQSAVSDPTASGTSLTFIKTISQNAQGVITPTKATVSTMGAASASAAGTAGLVPAPAKGNQGLFLRGDGTWATPTNTTYSTATSSALGLVKIGYTTSGKNYAVQLSDGKMYVNVPWTDTNTTYSNMTGATSSAAGAAGLVPAPAAGKQGQYLRGDGTWATPTNTTYSNMTGASASAAGASGLVPGPAKGNQGLFLRGDGTWATPTNTTYSTATSSALGLVKIGYTTSGKNYAVQLSDGKMYVNVPWTDTNTTYSEATSSAYGLVKIGYTASGKNYPVLLSSGKMYVNVPWTDTNTTYSAADGVALSGTTFYNTGVRSVSISGSKLRFNINGTNTDITVPYAATAGTVQNVPVNDLNLGNKSSDGAGDIIIDQIAAFGGIVAAYDTTGVGLIPYIRGGSGTKYWAIKVVNPSTFAVSPNTSVQGLHIRYY